MPNSNHNLCDGGVLEGLTFEWRSKCLCFGWVSLRFGSLALWSSERMESPPFRRRHASAIPLGPRKPINETAIKNPEKGGLGEWWEFPGNFKQGSVSFFGEDPDWVITFRGEGYHLGFCNLMKLVGVTFWILRLAPCWGWPRLHGTPMLEWCCFQRLFCWFSPYLKAVSVGCRIPWDIRYDDFSVVHVVGVIDHSEGLEAFPCHALQVPKIFDSSAAIIGNDASFTNTTYS
jgi:hypothetical protein